MVAQILDFPSLPEPHTCYKRRMLAEMRKAAEHVRNAKYYAYKQGEGRLEDFLNTYAVSLERNANAVEREGQ